MSLQPDSLEKFDVVIIGAGVAGSVLARLLAEENKQVLLLEKDTYSGKTIACGGLLDKSHFDKCQLPEDVIEQFIHKNIFVLPWGEVCFEADQVTVKRRKFDRALAQLAQSRGAVLRNQSRALDYEVLKPGQVRVTINNNTTGTRYQVESKLIAFADGPFSLARKNPRFASEKNKPFWAYAYAYETEGIPFEPDVIKIYFEKELFPWGYGWIFPNQSDSNVGVGTLLKFAPQKSGLKQKQQFFLNKYKRTAPLLSDSEIKDKKGGYLPMKLIDSFADDSQVVLGDAAGMVSSLFGAGIDYAIDAAQACAPVLIKALQQNNFSQTVLSAYEQKIRNSFLKDLKKQWIVSRLIIFSERFNTNWPIKILAVIAFGGKYSRWNKIRILLFPLLGKPAPLQNTKTNIEHR